MFRNSSLLFVAMNNIAWPEISVVFNAAKLASSSFTTLSCPILLRNDTAEW